MLVQWWICGPANLVQSILSLPKLHLQNAQPRKRRQALLTRSLTLGVHGLTLFAGLGIGGHLKDHVGCPCAREIIPDTVLRRPVYQWLV